MEQCTASRNELCERLRWPLFCLCYNRFDMKEFVLQDDKDLSSMRIDYAGELNAEQLDVVLHGDGPSLVLAGAGSGKTRTITYRVAYLLEKGVSPEHILLVTFTNKASKEMLGRVESLLGSYPTGLWGGTFHSIGNRLLRMYADKVGHTPNFTIMDQEDANALIKVCVKELKIDTGERRFPSPKKLHGMISYSRNAGRRLIEVIEERYASFADMAPMIERVAELYAFRKQEADAMDFDDLLLKVRDLLHTDVMVRERLASQFEYVLVDEYQDTNVVQAQIVSALSSVHRNLLVVGDDAQSIYSFRAAEIKNILGFPRAFDGTKTFKLTTNYRSTPEILAVANASIAQNAQQFQKELTAVRGPIERPSLAPAQTSNQEAQYIAQQVLALRDEGIPLSEMAVLFRAAFHSQALEFELMRRDIPYEYRGGLKFFERAHVKDVVAYLRVKMNPKDEVAWMRILGKLPGIGLVTAQKIIAQIRGIESLDELAGVEVKVPKRATSGWQQMGRTLAKMSAEELPAELIRSVVGGDYRDYLEAEYPDFMDRLDDLEQFALFAEGYKSLRTFLDEVSLSADYGAVREEGEVFHEEKMILSTVHQSKGLEWDVVFVMHLSEGKFPNARSVEDEDGIAEERRLFYVATTRARKRLFYTYPITTGYDTLMIGQPSLFLQELPTSLCEQVRVKRSAVASRPSSSWGDYDDGPSIVLDEFGETVNKPDVGGMAFLRDV